MFITDSRVKEYQNQDNTFSHIDLDNDALFPRGFQGNMNYWSEDKKRNNDSVQHFFHAAMFSWDRNKVS